MKIEMASVECLLSSGEDLLCLDHEASYEAALSLFQEALQIAQGQGRCHDEVRALQCLGNAYAMKQQSELAIATLEQAIAIATTTADLSTLAQCHRQLAYVYKASQNFEAALHHLESAEATRSNLLLNQVMPQFQAGESLYSLFHSVPIGLYRILPDGSPLEVNPAFIELLGFPNSDAFYGSRQAEMHLRGMLSQISQCDLDADGVLHNCELRLTRYDGDQLWVRLHLRLVRRVDGSLLYYEGAMEDISEAKAAQQALEELATIDSLTHVFNRRHFLDLAQQEITRAMRFQRPLALIMIDIDHFKAVNDAYGHLTGDQVLQEVAFHLRTHLRQSDILARFGGEEFIILMPETSPEQAYEGAERLRQWVAQNPYSGFQCCIGVTLSLGLTSWLPSPTGPVPYLDDLIHQADQTLYKAKGSGRNQTQIYSPGG